jgi:hypothetical protein
VLFRDLCHTLMVTLIDTHISGRIRHVEDVRLLKSTQRHVHVIVVSIAAASNLINGSLACRACCDHRFSINAYAACAMHLTDVIEDNATLIELEELQNDLYQHLIRRFGPAVASGVSRVTKSQPNSHPIKTACLSLSTCR